MPPKPNAKPSPAAKPKAKGASSAPPAAAAAAPVKKELSVSQKEIVRKVKALFHLAGPVNLTFFFPIFVIGEALFKKEPLDPCFRTALREVELLKTYLQTEQQFLIATAVLVALAIAGIIGGFLLLRSAMGHIDAAGGTIAPNDPPQTLVVTGPYAHVRNPVALAQLMILVSEGLLTGLPKIMILAGIYTTYLLINTPCSEEPAMRRRFGADWVHYKYAVGAWCPRCSPWQPGREQV